MAVSPSDETQHSGDEPSQFTVVDYFGLPRRIRVVMKPVRVFNEIKELLGVLSVQNLL